MGFAVTLHGADRKTILLGVARYRKQAAACSLLAALLVVIIGILLFRFGAGDPPDCVTIGLCGATNSSSLPPNSVMANSVIFLATNTAPRTLRYCAWTEKKVNGTWPPRIGPLPYSKLFDVPKGYDFQLAASPPPDDAPWRICVCYSLLDTRIGEAARWKVAEFFYDRNFNTIGRLFHKGVVARIAEGPEMQGAKTASN